MSSPYPISKSVRWRMKDWFSCLIACRLPTVDEEKEGISTPSTPTTSVSNRRKGGRKRRKCFDRQSSIELASNEGLKEADIKVLSIEKEASKDSSSRSLMSEEDFIEFGFKENGQIHKIEEKEQIRSKPVNLKEKEEGGNHCSSSGQWLPDAIIEEIEYNHFVEERHNETNQEEGTLLQSRSCSNVSSDGSTASFTFPILIGSRSSWEWKGSPIFMAPRPKDASQ